MLRVPTVRMPGGVIIQDGAGGQESDHPACEGSNQNLDAEPAIATLNSAQDSNPDSMGSG
ncbi:hypothetical protein ACIQTW_11610 [Paenarthrobacter sp. NPDC090517]|uniref:hypothetical protein n=1 Tax=Paenarthrobacter sp. NPDC090517 TaxID=3364381 RepID=UPI00382D9578